MSVRVHTERVKQENLKAHLTDMFIDINWMIGMYEISEDNCLEYYRRMGIYERAMGPMFMPGAPTLTLADVKSYIGFRTNQPFNTPAQFKAVVFKQLTESVSRDIQEQEQERIRCNPEAMPAIIDSLGYVSVAGRMVHTAHQHGLLHLRQKSSDKSGAR